MKSLFHHSATKTLSKFTFAFVTDLVLTLLKCCTLKWQLTSIETKDFNRYDPHHELSINYDCLDDDDLE